MRLQKKVLLKQYKNLRLTDLTIYVLMDHSFWFESTNLGVSVVYMEETQVITTN